LITKIKKLKQEVQDLKNKPRKTPAQQQELINKEKELEDLNKELTTTQNNKEPKNFPTEFLIIGGIILISLVFLIFVVKRIKKSRIKKR
jgi:DNA repair exonuclease SbcCD ATPase subunit